MAGILVCGLNGCGKSTLGRALATHLRMTFIDVEDLYFPKTDPTNPYTDARSETEVGELLTKHIAVHPDFVFASVTGKYAEDVFIQQLRCAILIEVPREIRLRRVRDRSWRRFGERIKPGGDLHKKEEAFYAMVAARPEQLVEQWLQRLTCPVLRIDGTKPTEVNIRLIVDQLSSL